MNTAPHGFSLRPASRHDSPAITSLVFGILAGCGLEADPAGTDADLGDIENFYHKAGGCFDVLMDDATGRIVGTVALHPMGSGAVELRKMYLHPDYRGRGLGRVLLNHAVAQAKERGFSRVFLETAAVLREAIGLYRSAGFQPCELKHLSSRCDQAMVLVLGEPPSAV